MSAILNDTSFTAFKSVLLSNCARCCFCFSRKFRIWVRYELEWSGCLGEGLSACVLTIRDRRGGKGEIVSPRVSHAEDRPT